MNFIRYQTKVASGGSGPKKISSQGQPRAVQLLNPNKLKIVGGTAKGKKIDSPDVYLRPMMAKVTEYLNRLFSVSSHSLIVSELFSQPRALNVYSVGERGPIQYSVACRCIQRKHHEGFRHVRWIWFSWS
jgi:hypothetical protein